MIREGISELPVVDSAGKLVGQVNMYEIIKAYRAEILGEKHG